MWFINWFNSITWSPSTEDITKQCSCNWKINIAHLQWCKYWDKIKQVNK